MRAYKTLSRTVLTGAAAGVAPTANAASPNTKARNVLAVIVISSARGTNARKATEKNRLRRPRRFPHPGLLRQNLSKPSGFLVPPLPAC